MDWARHHGRGAWRGVVALRPGPPAVSPGGRSGLVLPGRGARGGACGRRRRLRPSRPLRADRRVARRRQDAGRAEVARPPSADVPRVVVPNSRASQPADLFQAILFDLGKPYQGLTEQELRLAVTGQLLDAATEGTFP